MNIIDKAHELTDAIRGIATMTKDGKALCDKAFEKALREAYEEGLEEGKEIARKERRM